MRAGDLKSLRRLFFPAFFSIDNARFCHDEHKVSVKGQPILVRRLTERQPERLFSGHEISCEDP